MTTMESEGLPGGYVKPSLFVTGQGNAQPANITPLGDGFIYSIVWDGANVDFFSRGRADLGNPHTLTEGISNVETALGYSPHGAGGRYYDGKLAALALYTNVLTKSERQDVEIFLIISR